MLLPAVRLLLRHRLRDTPRVEVLQREQLLIWLYLGAPARREGTLTLPRGRAEILLSEWRQSLVFAPFLSLNA